MFVQHYLVCHYLSVKCQGLGRGISVVDKPSVIAVGIIITA